MENRERRGTGGRKEGGGDRPKGKRSGERSERSGGGGRDEGGRGRSGGGRSSGGRGGNPRTGGRGKFEGRKTSGGRGDQHRRHDDRGGENRREREPEGMDPVEFWSICSVNGVPLSHEQMDQFARYAEDLLYWNDQINLISRRDTPHIWGRHLLHSITPVLMKLLPESGRILDIGTGGGLPGIPIKITLPKLDVTMLDSIAKKVRTTGMLASHISEHGLRAIRERAEELVNDPQHVGAYDAVVARAVAPLVDLIGWAKPLLKPQGSIVALKGGALTDEIDHALHKFPEAQIQILDIEVRGTDWFTQENKRIVTVRFDSEPSS
ncbi:MAG: 16S rRNA (guanine(527)-N(7))-methyltransferase RsmG [Candidatus Kapaibacterium sp.]